MIQSLPLSIAFAVMGLWFLYRGFGGAAAGPAERVTHVAHAVMAAAMTAMCWPMG